MQFTTAILAIFVASAVAVPTFGSGDGQCNFRQNNQVQQGSVICCIKGDHTSSGSTQSGSGLIGNVLGLATGDLLSDISCAVNLCGTQALNNVGVLANNNNAICCKNVNSQGVINVNVLSTSCGKLLL
ncbi:hypothetical protein FPQ18DRAFT_322423 [Pyronema domesticum]|uniref:Hydrophobin n=1 Tax=Pyronema omphalodes (strain CBS 100304) TaxID=1076935 RepID=U4LML9_PYROM|nr:hypothetical protein FPQ18DRAFT_322423 [Pyronema domesticum]CCX33369.1 Protein of unknown function [Pyronema omphalodes CBS 100304]